MYLLVYHWWTVPNPMSNKYVEDALKESTISLSICFRALDPYLSKSISHALIQAIEFFEMLFRRWARLKANIFTFLITRTYEHDNFSHAPKEANQFSIAVQTITQMKFRSAKTNNIFVTATTKTTFYWKITTSHLWWRKTDAISSREQQEQINMKSKYNWKLAGKVATEIVKDIYSYLLTNDIFTRVSLRSSSSSCP